jgi:hypothetical protein
MRYRCGMNRVNQSPDWIQTNVDRALAILEKRNADLLRLRDEVEQLSCKLQRMDESQTGQMENAGLINLAFCCLRAHPHGS